MFHKVTFDNGLRLVVEPITRIDSVCLGIFIGVGSRHERDAEAGISHFIEHMCFKGTARRPSSQEICEAVEGVGGVINAGTGKEATSYWCKIAKSHFDLALDVLADLVLNPVFAAEAIDAERRVIIEEINSSLDSPHYLVNILVDRLLWRRHPLGRDIAGTKDSVTGLTRDQIAGFHRSQYLPDHAVLALAGNIDIDDATKRVEQAFASWKPGAPTGPLQAVGPQSTPRCYVESKETEQAHLCLAVPGLSLFDPDRYVLGLLNAVLGGGMSSRLFREIREKRSLAYDIHSYADHFQDSGSLTVYAGVAPKQLKTATTAILEQLAELKEKPVPGDELNRAKELSKGRLLLRMEDSHSVVSWLGGQEMLTGRIQSVEEVLSCCDIITPDDIKRVAAKLLSADKLNLAVVGPITNDQPLQDILRL